MPAILTTHVGSLLRGEELVPLLLARDKGLPYDPDAFDRRVQAAVADAVTKQVEAAISTKKHGRSAPPASGTAHLALARHRQFG